MRLDYAKLRMHATDAQLACLSAMESTGSVRKAAELLNISHQAVSSSIRRLQQYVDKHDGDKKPFHGESWLVIPDMQIKPGIDLTFVRCIGEYILSKRPHGVINLGDMADMESLSSYDKGKRSFEGRRYNNDTASVITAQEMLWAPVRKHNSKCKTKDQYTPRSVFLMGNHEERGDRVTQIDPMLEGTINIKEDLKLAEYWDEVHDFQEVVTINGVAFSHYFGTGPMGRPCGTAQLQLNKMHMSCVSGHQPGRQTYNAKAADGRLITSIIAGSSYDYELEYMGVQGNRHWRGIIMLHNMKNGEFDEIYVPIEYLKQKYGK